MGGPDPFQNKTIAVLGLAFKSNTMTRGNCRISAIWRRAGKAWPMTAGMDPAVMGEAAWRFEAIACFRIFHER